MKSLRQSLAIWDIEPPPPCCMPDVFQTHPGSLREIVHILNLADPSFEEMTKHRIHEFTENDAQGLAYAHGTIWFLSSQENLFKYSYMGDDPYRPAFAVKLQKKPLSRLLTEAGLDEDEYDHIGDIDYLDGLLFAPVRHRSGPPHALLALSEDLEVVGYAGLLPSTKDSWCAINPWNRLLYMPHETSEEYLDAYEPAAFYTILEDQDQSRWGERADLPPRDDKRFHFYQEDGSPDQVPSIQGVAFSENGRLYVARYRHERYWVFPFVWVDRWHNFLHVYSALTGRLLDISKEYDFDGIGDEIEGISVHPSGIIYVAVAENDPETAVDSDEFHVYAFKYKDSAFPV